ncbi:MAG: tryptophan--tRNA ligase [Bdellovibrionales bacterium RIFCSPHIGHO2_01_FULL_40_29]|nr:MAG: tryptophan--tRNA ligase [Bdellovibrionales bacterium RIFCSPHIGHO2_01_FULL_40_29]OFZ35606.1 MAG: tryptophan--tRNA ligase [Bdellovibrionales bacterium RIFCSPHIGHO2_02_FULL_40_15]
MRVMSGTRTSGALHLGHYLGWLSNCLKMQDQYDCYFGVMDWHGMTSAYKSTHEIPNWNRDIFAEMIAWGLDPEKSTMFIQSHVPEHIELFMIFSNLTPMGWLERVTTWKDAQEDAKANDTHNLGRFAYPVLQAADIAIYSGQLVPVGADQVSHLELTREIIRRFNHLYKAKLPEPKPLLTETPAFPGLDGRKMSKSYGNSILLSEESKSLKRKINSMVTDPQRALRENPGNPLVCNVYTYHKLFSSETDQKWTVEGCTTAGIGCGDCKAKLCGNIEQLIEKPREKKKELLNNPKQLDSIILAGCEKARTEASQNLKTIKQYMKLIV